MENDIETLAVLRVVMGNQIERTWKMNWKLG